MAQTINQARANYKKYFKTDAAEDLSVDAIVKAIDDAKAESAVAKAAADAKKAADKAEADLIAAEKAAANAQPKWKARFPNVEIPKMGVFTAEELEANPAACEYLFEIGSPAIIKLDE